jgi:catechol 2,3-dioxygenase-like lactoylglutathione lyase family enzyme
MDQRVSLITLGVSDLGRAIAFYRDVLGWAPHHVIEGDVAFIDLGGVVLALWGHDALATELDLDPQLGPYHGFALAHNVASREAVDAIFAAVGAAGARITRPPAATEWGGYSGYVEDPDGHRWEIAHNPSWPLDADGRVRLDAPPG